ncbi:uncharacterized protein LOC112520193 [Cynara cardunculus var. scolymus]|uniref:uncharacterized protein LOC112520193 n=1 Tax=Cynara cardunculus var. scolymus TaxID=59895 RepID=UPI000D6304E9|nr:uncharacterized protein LOC112520193 [Cynara cardunculus var. scolymus]
MAENLKWNREKSGRKEQQVQNHSRDQAGAIHLKADISLNLPSFNPSPYEDSGISLNLPSFNRSIHLHLQCASPRQVPVVSTGSFALDIALGVGGFPKGRVVEIYVPEASGETTLALHVIAEAQKQGGEQEVPVSNTGFYVLYWT